MAIRIHRLGIPGGTAATTIRPDIHISTGVPRPTTTHTIRAAGTGAGSAQQPARNFFQTTNKDHVWKLIFEQIKVGSYENFAYLLGDPQSRNAAVVDPAWEVDKILDSARNHGLLVNYVINTHSHPDHVEGNSKIVDRTAARIVAHKLAPGRKDIPVDDGDIFHVGSLEIHVMHTPGHCPDHVCLLINGKVLTGDTLFVGECGRTDLPGGSASELYDSLFNKLMKLEDSVEVYPGHDYGQRPYSTIGHERQNNYVLKPRTREQFIQFMAQP